MLLFKKRFVKPILEGKKWQTRRLKKPNVKVGGIYQCKTSRFSPHAFAKVKVTNIRKQRLSEITESEVKAEGMESKEEFIKLFKEIYNLSAESDPEVWVIEFHTVDQD
ncbi:MAG: hypothetical protein DRG27_00660 [Deltaproteobacteria bacterium]|nr:MAG: hypothetical protein DRG27_00660 [Deltaproteobacteria bacterium]